MKKLIILVMLLGVVTLQGFAREKYRILIRKTLDGKEIYLTATEKKINMN